MMLHLADMSSSYLVLFSLFSFFPFYYIIFFHLSLVSPLLFFFHNSHATFDACYVETLGLVFLHDGFKRKATEFVWATMILGQIPHADDDHE